MSASPLKVLIIDDEPPIRKLLRMGLGTQGYEILDAPNGKTALALLDGKPDLVILDLGLPDMDGKEVIQRIREWPDAPIPAHTRRLPRQSSCSPRWRRSTRE